MYELPKGLKKRLAKELDNAPNKATLHGAISKEIFPDLTRTALLIGDKLNLYSYE
ncbi:hypothetical protein [Aequorivita marina]|uniref:hypothetical protein n=1 Tax=Aequorivita marina TaxID=3073654 RepID=UPI002876F029|nr:hypothetical protein [Aequorivita sp. S2608]MDS1297741.1 hypothetical protein [Aequorivita sp. S2608]